MPDQCPPGECEWALGAEDDAWSFEFHCTICYEHVTPLNPTEVRELMERAGIRCYRAGCADSGKESSDTLPLSVATLVVTDILAERAKP
ncbi:MAG: hypothetical protein B7733_08535 [Myxococcales bacterium FL481]|nr:MAG: hypothetical protein B7733_08535 [Myxococcales bacterium FL481]